MKGTIYLKGTAYPCRLTMGAILRLKEKTSLDLMAVGEGQQLDMSFLMALIWVCLVSSCKADDLALPCKEEELPDLLELRDYITWQQQNFTGGTSIENEESEKKVENV